MRLFVAIQPSPDFLEALKDLQGRLSDTGITGKWLEPDGLHMTLAFIGEWPEEVTDVLPVIQRPFSITLSHLGVFPESNVLWAGVEPSIDLEHLAKRVRHSLADAEIPFDRKSFSPHITLIRKPFIPERIALSEIKVPKVSMLVDDVCLYRSDHGKNGMVYTVIGSSGEKNSMSEM